MLFFFLLSWDRNLGSKMSLILGKETTEARREKSSRESFCFFGHERARSLLCLTRNKTPPSETGRSSYLEYIVSTCGHRKEMDTRKLREGNRIPNVQKAKPFPSSLCLFLRKYDKGENKEEMCMDLQVQRSSECD